MAKLGSVQRPLATFRCSANLLYFSCQNDYRAYSPCKLKKRFSRVFLKVQVRGGEINKARLGLILLIFSIEEGMSSVISLHEVHSMSPDSSEKILIEII